MWVAPVTLGRLVLTSVQPGLKRGPFLINLGLTFGDLGPVFSELGAIPVYGRRLVEAVISCDVDSV